MYRIYSGMALKSTSSTLEPERPQHYRPVLFFRHLRLIAVSFPQGKIWHAFQKLSSIFAFLKIGWVWNCIRQGESKPGSILKVVHCFALLIYLDYNTGGVIKSKVNKERYLSLSGDVVYSMRISCKTLEAWVVEILSVCFVFWSSQVWVLLRNPTVFTGLVMSFLINFQKNSDIIPAHFILYLFIFALR
jgi:hypothetical protein